MTAAPLSPPPAGGDLLTLMRDGLPRTRAELISLTGLARSTVAGRIDALMGLQLLQAAGQSRSTGGRPPVEFAFNASCRVVLAADFGAAHAQLALTDLDGEVLAQVPGDLRIAAGPERALSWLVESAATLLAEVGRPIGDLAGVGIGLPGPVEHDSGRPVKPPIMPGWDGFDVAGYVGERLETKVLVDNDVNMMALGEHSRVYPEVEHLVFVKVATGIGAGIISGRRLHRGAQGSAGDLGHVASPHGGDALCSCGNHGCLEAIASAQAIALELGLEDLSRGASRAVLTRIGEGDQAATAAVRRAGRNLGEVLASTVSLLNPSVIVLGGNLAEGAPSLLAGVREVVYARSLPLATGNLSVLGSRTGALAGIAGASTMVVQHFLAPESIDVLLASPAPAAS